MKQHSAMYAKELERANRLRNPLQRPQELMDLLKISSNYDTNYVLVSTKILEALADIVVVQCLEWNDEEDSADAQVKIKDTDDEHLNLLLRSKVAWERPPTKRMTQWMQYCTIYSGLYADSIRILEAVAMIYRNFSYTGANVRVMAYSPCVLYSLVAFLTIGAKNPFYRQHQLRTGMRSSTTLTTPSGMSSGGNSTTADPESISASALQTLLHCVRHLDVTGQQLIADKLFNHMNLHDDDLFGQCMPGRSWGDSLGACWFARRLRDDTMEQSIPTSMVLDLAADFLTGVWSIFPALVPAVLSSNRSVVLLALELLSEWIGLARVGLVGDVIPEDETIQPGDNYSIPGIRAILAHIPDVVLKRLVELLSVPRLGNDGLDYVDPSKNVVARVNNLKLLTTYDQSIDSELRDRALEVLVPLIELDSPRMAKRFGKLCSFRYSILPILTSAVGRSEAPLLATQLMKELGQAEENMPQIQAIQPELVELASSNLRISRLVWSDLFPIERDSRLVGHEHDAVMTG